MQANDRMDFFHFTIVEEGIKIRVLTRFTTNFIDSGDRNGSYGQSEK